MSGTRAISSRRINMVTVDSVVKFLDEQHTPTKAQKRHLKEDAKMLRSQHSYNRNARIRRQYANFDKVNENLASAFGIVRKDETHLLNADWGRAALDLNHAVQQINRSADSPASPVMEYYIKMKGVPMRAKDFVAKSMKEYYGDDDKPESAALTELVAYIFKNCEQPPLEGVTSSHGIRQYINLKHLNSLWTPDELAQSRIDAAVAYNKKSHLRDVERGWDKGDFDEAQARFDAYGYQQWPKIRTVIQGIITDGTTKILEGSGTPTTAKAKHLLINAMLEHEYAQEAHLLTALYINQVYLDIQDRATVKSVASYQPSESYNAAFEPPTLVRYYDVEQPSINNEYLARMVVPVRDYYQTLVTARRGSFVVLAQRILKKYSDTSAADAKQRVEYQKASDKRTHESMKKELKGAHGFSSAIGILLNEMIREDDGQLPETFMWRGVSIKTSEWIEWIGGRDKLVNAFRSTLNQNVASRKQLLVDAKKQYKRTLKHRLDILVGLEE